MFDAIFDAREHDPEGLYVVPVDALPLLAQTHQTVAALLLDPPCLQDPLPQPPGDLRRALLESARIARQPVSTGTAPEARTVEERGHLTPTLGRRPSRGSQSAEERRQRLLPTFLAESRHLVDTLHGHIDTMREDPTDVHALLGSTRALHTLKGNASSMHVDAIAQLTHAGESLLEQLATTAAPVSSTQLGLLSDLDGAIRHVIDTLDHGETYDSVAIGPLLAALSSPRVDSQAEVTAAPQEPVASIRALHDEPPNATAMVRLDQIRFAPQSLAAEGRETFDAAAPVPSRAPVPRPLFMPRSSSEPERARIQRRSLTENITSVELREVDTAVDLFGRLVISRTMIASGIQDLQRPATESMRNSQRLHAVIDKLSSEFESVRRERRAASHREGWDALEMETFDTHAQIMLELGEIIADQEEIAGNLGEGVRRTSMVCEGDQETADELQRVLLGFRLVRLSTIEPRLDQVITATARAVDRQITWKLRGGSIAVDKAVLDAVQEPLLHILRNAIDHGIESPEERAACGKPSAGAVTVEASYGTNSAIIRVTDDGGGIDPEKIVATAVQRGLITAEMAASLDKRSKLELIWQPGFSTASTVTDISGRGVGLDIVRSAISRVRGSVTLQTAVGRGTTFILTLPLSLSVVRTLVLRDGNATVAVPIAQIDGVHLVQKDDISKLADRSVAMVEGRTVTLLAQGLAQTTPLEERLSGESVVVVEVSVGAERTVGYVIDEVLGEEDTLVKALPQYLQHRTAFVGCSVAGSGRPYAIVDLRQLAEQSGISRGIRSTAGRMGLSTPSVQAAKPMVLIVDDSLFMRRSLTEVYQLGGFRVETAEDGEAALAAIARLGLPDLISLDMEMPRMNGLEMLSIFRQLPGGQHIPVFMITTRGQERHRQAAISAGVSRYFIKPFNGDDLLAAARDECRPALASSIA